MRAGTIAWGFALIACGPTIEEEDEPATTTNNVLMTSSAPESTSTSTSSSTSPPDSTSSSTSDSMPSSTSESFTTSGPPEDWINECDRRFVVGETDGPVNCFGEIELVDVELDVTTNRIFGEDIPIAFDLDRGSEACVRVDDGWVRIILTMGPFAEWGPCTTINVEVGDGARLYDLATDPGPPGTGNRGLFGLGNAYQGDSTTTWSFSTINQAGVGTVDVVSLPVDGEARLELAAQGAIANPDGWEFDFRVSATMAQ